MAIRYVRKTGSDSNNGTTPALAWATIGKALGSTGISSGDTVYIGAGVYRETVSVAMTNPTANTFIIGDTTGFYTGDAGEVVITAYTTNDTTVPVATPTFNGNSRNYLNLQNITMYGGNTYGGILTIANNERFWRFTNCVFVSYKGTTGCTWYNNAGVSAGGTFERCVFVACGNQQFEYYPNTHSADYDVGVTFDACLFIGSCYSSFYFGTPGGALAGKPGGMILKNCSFFNFGNAIQIDHANYSTTIPVRIYNCVIFTGPQVGIVANTLGQIVEDYNVITANTARTNVTAGANSKVTFEPRIHFGHEMWVLNNPRPLYTPSDGSNYLAVGQNTSYVSLQSLDNKPTAYSINSTANHIGAFSRVNNAKRETTTVRTGSNSIAITGVGTVDFDIPVDNVATTISIYGRYDTTHATTNKPQMQILASADIGVSLTTSTMTVAANTWELLTLSVTPTAKGVLTVRLISRSASASGKAFFDDFTIVKS